MNKKAIAILGGIFVLIVGTLSFIIWYRSSSNSTPEEVATEEPTVVEEPVVEVPVEEEEVPVEEETPTSQATRLTNDSVITPALFFQGDGIAYFNNQGQLFRTQMSITGNTVLLSNKTELVVPQKSNIRRILWPAVGSSYIAESGDGASRTWSYYNPDTGSYVDLPRQVKSVDWMPSGNKILFVWVGDDGKATLNISDPDTSNYQVLTDLYEPDNEIKVSPDGQTILFYRTQSSDLTKNSIVSVTPDGKNFKTLVRDGYNRGVLFSPDSKKFLFTRKDPSTQATALYMGDVATGEIRSLGYNTTETKALWGKDSLSIIMAVPSTSSTGSSDRIYKLDLYSNSTTQYDPGANMDVEEMFVSLDNKVLFFKNGNDNSLYYLMMQ